MKSLFTSSSFVFLLYISLASAQVNNNSLLPCSCSFATLNETGCRVYGSVPGTSGIQTLLVPWFQGDHQCLVDMASAVNGTLEYPFQTYIDMCPYPNGTDFSAAGFAAFVQNPSDNQGPTARLIMSGYPEYFYSTDGGQIYQLKPNITSATGSPIDCITTPQFCWSKIEYDLEADPREGGYICERAYALMSRGMAAQQAVLRRALCARSTGSNSTVSPPPSSCSCLTAQIQDVLGMGASCSDVSTGPGNNAVPPNCTGAISATDCPNNSTGSGGGGGSGTSHAVRLPSSWMWGVATLTVLVGSVISC